MIILHGKQDIVETSKSCSIVAHVLSCLEKEVCPGITTDYLNTLAEKLTFENKSSKDRNLRPRKSFL